MSVSSKASAVPSKPLDSYTFTVGKLDAGMAILLGERAHLIEFPSLLLPPGATTGSIVNILVTQNVDAEKKRDVAFWQLQDDILETFGRRLPKAPEISVRNVTQTSVALEWPPLDLATATLRSLDIYRNGVRLASIPSPLTNTTTKLSGLDLNTEYTFRLVLRTSAGNFPSNIAKVRTHTMSDTSGISVCFGNVQDPVLLEQAKIALREMRAKWTEKIQIDTTHFVCTTPAAVQTASSASPQLASAPGVEYQRALQMSIPIVQPQWILACLSEKKMVPISGYYLGATPATPMNAAPFSRPQSMSQTSLPRSAGASSRVNLPGSHSRTQSTPQGSSLSPPSAEPAPPKFEPTPEEPGEPAEGDDEESQVKSPSSKPATPHMRHGTMDRAFKFPPSKSSPLGETESTVPEQEQPTVQSNAQPQRVLSVEVPPPPSPQEKERALPVSPADEDVGETEEISLN
ncbi:hypothetical protein K488DRAFT_45613 [Vararia minispora EC-137]|uniref:Uncharacterized protein n=1 Tax=Vararia minispora EC-137 TaxID=1314806 RepID=A0ACB8QR47_9AGAM|nr:hypothetical protein K488DRAFT_45613 [Vararia minispora EC-137]